MKHSEKKYRVDSFDAVMTKLKEVGAKQVKKTTSTHYYAKLDSNDVTKLVVYSDKSEIHVLKESNGTFSLTDNIPVKDGQDGLKWLKDHSYTSVGVVKMDYINFEYNGGVVGLYTINDDLLSVILDFPADLHKQMEHIFGLTDAEVIEMPYNKYLEKIGKLETKDLNE